MKKLTDRLQPDRVDAFKAAAAPAMKKVIIIFIKSLSWCIELFSGMGRNV